MRIIVLTIFVVAICSGIGFGTGHYLIDGKKWVGITVGGAFGIGVVAGYAAAMQHPFINASECFTTPPQAVLAQPPPAGRGKLLQANAQQSAAADAVGVTITDDDDDDGLAVDDPNLARAVSCGDGGLGQLFGAPKDEVDKVAVGWTPNILVLDMRTAALRSSLRGTTLTAAQWEQRECSRGPLSPRSTGDSPTPKGWPPRRAPPQALSPGRESRAAQPYLGVPRSTLPPRSPRKEKDTHSCNEEGLKPGGGPLSQECRRALSPSLDTHPLQEERGHCRKCHIISELSSRARARPARLSRRRHKGCRSGSRHCSRRCRFTPPPPPSHTLSQSQKAQPPLPPPPLPRAYTSRRRQRR